MAEQGEVAALRVADEDFLVATTIDRCPKTMMLRELFKNAVEAAAQTAGRDAQIEFRVKEIGGVPKLAIWNTGPGMSAHELHRMCDIASSIGKDKGLDENFGMGAKVASLPSNRLGLRYRSCKAGTVSEVILCQRSGIYGRLRREVDGRSDEVIDVTEVCQAEGMPINFDWTEVVLFGNRIEQNTARDPYDSNPKVVSQWLADYLYHRFFRLPESINVRLHPGTHKLDGIRLFKTIPERAYRFGQAETVQLEDGTKIHYFYDPPLSGGASHNASVSGAITTDVSTCAIVYKDEIYDLKRGKQWNLDAPIFGVTFGAKHISVHVELSDDYGVRPEAYRQFLRYREGDQRQAAVLDFADAVREKRPIWLIDVIRSFSPADADPTVDVRSELQRLLDRLRLKTMGPRLGNGEIQVDAGAGKGARPDPEGVGNRTPGQPKITADDIVAVPAGAKRAALALNAERVPQIIQLRDPAEIEEKGFAGKAAKFYPETSQLFVNMLYPSVGQMRDLLEEEYAAAADIEAMRKMANDFAERTILIRVGRAVVFALAKRLNREWTVEDTARAGLAPEKWRGLTD